MTHAVTVQSAGGYRRVEPPLAPATEDRRTPRQRVLAALTQRVSTGLHLGVLTYGDRLPSTRAIAREFSVDPRVALAAYKLLEAKGIVELRPRSGIYVADPSPSDKPFAPAQYVWLIDTLSEAIAQGVPALEFGDRVRRSMETLRLRALVLECNDDQLFSVSEELQRDYGLEVFAVDVDTMGDEIPRDAKRADCVVTTTAHSEKAEHVAREMGVPALVLSMCDDLFAEVGRLLKREQVYFVVSDPRFELKLKKFFMHAPGAENLRVLVHGRDDHNAIPPNAPAYLTRLTRKRAGAGPLVERVMPEARVFNEASTRRVLEFVVRANLRAARPA